MVGFDDLIASRSVETDFKTIDRIENIICCVEVVFKPQICNPNIGFLWQPFGKRNLAGVHSIDDTAKSLNIQFARLPVID